jgi:hypothetical protein
VITTYETEIAVGNVPNHLAIHIVSRIGSAGAVTTDFNNLDPLITKIPVPVTPIQFDIVSTDTADTAAGSGANTVEIHGLDANWDQISEVMTLNGTNVITTTNTYRRVNEFHVMSLGVGQSTAGIISVSNSAGGENYSTILDGENQQLQTHYTVPRSFNAIITGFSAGGLTGNTTTKGRICLLSTADPSDRNINTDVFYIEEIIEFNNETSFADFRLPKKVPPLGIIKATIVRAEGASSVTGNASIDLFIDPA